MLLGNWSTLGTWDGGGTVTVVTGAIDLTWEVAGSGGTYVPLNLTTFNGSTRMTFFVEGTWTYLWVTLPVIIILGDNPVSVAQGAVYNDAGATALDYPGGDLTSSIVTGNNVNIAGVGAYQVTYDVDDSLGNSAIQKVRIVNVTAVPGTRYHPPPKPRFRQYSQDELVNKLEGKERNKPEICYEFSDGSTFVDTDRTDSGIYKK